MAKENLRALSLDVIIEVLEKDGFSNQVLNQVLQKYQYLEKNERSFITRLSLGTIENMILLDEIISSFSKTKIKKMKPVIRNILRMSVYQIYFMDSVPESAVVNEAVKLAKKRGMAGLSGFVNGLLRNVIREEKPLSDFQKDLSTSYSCPKWLTDLWEEEYGAEITKEILEGFEGKDVTTIRTNLTKISPSELKSALEKEGMKVMPTGLEYAFYISGFDYLEKSESFQKGLFYVQDLSSMMVAESADIKGCEKVLDMCAAPGGKSLHVAEKLALKGDEGSVDARDVSLEKTSRIEENKKRTGLSNLYVKVWDATVLDKDAIENYDVVICDLPCSGLGVISKKPEIKYRASLEEIEDLANLQKEILKNGVQYVKSGGRLLYSTCTVNKKENDEVTNWISETYPDFVLQSEEQIFPKKDGWDGFYIAVFEKV